MYDPNWFYSSLAQCAAALVGLLGAVVATRMQQQLLDARKSADELKNRLHLFRHELQVLANSAEQFAPAANHQIAAMRSVLQTGGSKMRAPYDVRLWGGGGEPREIHVTESTVEDMDAQRRAVDPIVAALKSKFTDSEDLRPVCASLEQLCREVPAPFVAPIEAKLGTMRFNLNELKLHETRTSIRGPVVVTVILSVLSVFGLILPLYFLSAYAGTSKTVLLSGFAVGVIAIPAYIATQIAEIRSLRIVTLP